MFRSSPVVPRIGFSLAVILVAGCSSTQQGDWSQYVQLARANFWGRSQSVTLEQAAAIPYASLGYRLNDSSQGLLVLATDNSGTLLWTARSRVVLMTRNGRITRSVGLPHDRAAMTARSGTSLPPPAQAIQGAFRSDRLMDMPNLGYYSVPVTCISRARGMESITILGTTLPTRRIEENCSSTNPRWSFTDTYWVDAKSGFPWRSIQYLSPSRGKLQMDILRPPE
jgi:hypothetical protein